MSEFRGQPIVASSEGCMKYKSMSAALVWYPRLPLFRPIPWSLTLGLEVCNRVRYLLHIVFGLKTLSLFLRPSHKDHIRVAEMSTSRLAGWSGSYSLQSCGGGWSAGEDGCGEDGQC